MKFWLGVTDNRWYEFVSTRGLDEVNFWQPSARPPFTTLPAGTPFLFKLKRPYNHVVGGGFSQITRRFHYRRRGTFLAKRMVRLHMQILKVLLVQTRVPRQRQIAKLGARLSRTCSIFHERIGFRLTGCSRTRSWWESNTTPPKRMAPHSGRRLSQLCAPLLTQLACMRNHLATVRRFFNEGDWGKAHSARLC